VVSREVEGEDPQLVAGYADDIRAGLAQDEVRFLPRANYMSSQPELTRKMRAVLVDWLVDVHRRYRLRMATLFLTVNLIDRFLACRAVQKTRLQLVGVTCLLIAAKFEEIDPPDVEDLAHMTDGAFTKRELISMESAICNALEFNIAGPTAAHFFEIYNRACRCDDTQRDFLQYILELCLVDIRFSHIAPSHLVAAATLLSNKIMRRSREAWPPEMVRCSNYVTADIKSVAKELCTLLERSSRSSLTALFRKFSRARYNSVATMNYMEAGFVGRP